MRELVERQHASPVAPDASADAAPDDRDEPHALGTIVLGEVHGSGAGGASASIIRASFSPNAALSKSCTKKLAAGCEIEEIPACDDDEESPTGCSANEVCGFDESCKAVCRKVPICADECEESARRARRNRARAHA